MSPDVEAKLQRAKHHLERQTQRASSAGVAVVRPDDMVLVVKAHYKPYWSFPGGIIDDRETPRQAAVRELHEETGLSIEPGSLVFRMIVDRVSSVAQTYQFVFETTIDSAAVELHGSDDEIEEYRFVSRQDIVAEVLDFSQTVVDWAAQRYGYHEQYFGPRPVDEIV